MSMHYTVANQYQDAYNPKALCNWQVPLWHPPAPLPQKRRTTVVSNNRGHLLPGIPRSKDNPWGNYVNTWNLPKKINREIANQLSAPNPIRIESYKYNLERAEKELKEAAKRKRYGKNYVEEPEVELPVVQDECRRCPCCWCFPCCCCNKDVTYQQSEEADEESFLNANEENKIKKKLQCPIHNEKYTPGSLTEDRQKFEGVVEEDVEEKLSGFPVYKVDHLERAKEKSSKELLAEMEHEMRMSNKKYCEEHGVKKRAEREVKVYLDTVRNFRLAKELHKVNLEHEPLPDTVPDRQFRRMQMEHPEKPAGLALDTGNFASAVGYKGHNGYGPTRCTKLKIFRPKTSNSADDESSINSFDKKWRFIKQNKVKPIDLAICWDVIPANPKDEPKRTKHIDGSNGSAAPAVFSMVPTPRPETAKETGNEKALFTQVPEPERPKTTDFKRTKSALNLDKRRSLSSTVSSKSTPDLSNIKCCSKNTRLCVACELQNLPPSKPKIKEEFKSAFKAGKPNSRSSSETSGSIVKVPKQRDPYGRKNYSINSLNGPFCLKKDKREDYPEHWRLASVYQHSYKPIHLRKKSLLQSVFQ